MVSQEELLGSDYSSPGVVKHYRDCLSICLIPNSKVQVTILRVVDKTLGYYSDDEESMITH